jgi:hypothetical protein
VHRERALAAVLLAALGLWPASAAGGGAGATVELHGGGLSSTGPDLVDLPPVRLIGLPVTAEAPAGPFRVVDTRTGAPGWTLVARAERPADALGRPMAAALQVVPATLPPGTSSPLTGPASLDVPRALMQAHPGGGTGAFGITPLLRLRVPADTPSATYTATLVVTVA